MDSAEDLQILNRIVSIITSATSLLNDNLATHIQTLLQYVSVTIQVVSVLHGYGNNCYVYI